MDLLVDHAAPSAESSEYTSHFARQAQREAEEEHKDIEASGETQKDDEEKPKPKQSKQHRPWFLWLMTAAQILALITSMGINWHTTGSPIQTGDNFNYFIGPAPGVLITMGARFVPCMRNTTSYLIEHYGTSDWICPPGIIGSSGNGSCTLTDICGFGGSVQPDEVPNQWYRFVLPMLLHAGILHLFMNLAFQLRQGLEMERDWGTWRVAGIYLASGIGGFIFGGNFSPMNPSVGCSGSIYGLVSALFLDLFQNWRVVKRPILQISIMVLQIAIALLIGMLPNIDNFAHIGGFYCGLVAGLILVPTVHYSTWDKWVKRAFFVLAIPGLILIFVFLIKGFYDVTTAQACPWCKYLNCIPGMPWCEQKWGQVA
ncbi:hypothetical protein HDV00_008182 [Rhizophlyctis rosea]|nr:hypothetical protein HDV00_008182 [Rhizophlyctis rosea]